MKIASMLMWLCLAACNVALAGEQIRLAHTDYSLTDDQLVQESRLAMAGSGVAARKVSNYYFFYAGRNLEKALEWALIGAENGDADSQFRVWQRLRVAAGDTMKHERALFWLRKAGTQGHVDAVIALKHCRSLDSKRKPNEAPCFGPEAEH